MIIIKIACLTKSFHQEQPHEGEHKIEAGNPGAHPYSLRSISDAGHRDYGGGVVPKRNETIYWS